MSGETEKEKLFLKLIEGFEWKYGAQEYPSSLFGFKGKEFLFEIYNSKELNQQKIIANYRFGSEQDLKNTEFWFNYDKIWSVFESKFGMNYSEIQSFMNGMVEKHFKIRRVTTIYLSCCNCHRVEKHLKLKKQNI
jgi:hypothetical protein